MNVEPKNVFLTDINLYKALNGKANLSKNTKKEEETTTNTKLPIVKTTTRNKTSPIKKERKKILEIEHYIDAIVDEMKGEIKNHPETKPLNTQTVNKDNLELLKQRKTDQFLKLHRQSMEKAISSKYMYDRNSELDNFIKKTEKNPSYQDVLKKKEEQLISLKNQFNKKRYILETFDKEIAILKQKSEKLISSKQGKRAIIRAKETDQVNSCYNNPINNIIKTEQYVLEEMRKEYKEDIFIIRKNSQIMKQMFDKIKEHNKLLISELNREQSILRGKEKKVNLKKENETIHGIDDDLKIATSTQFSHYDSSVKLESIIVNDQIVRKKVKAEKKRIEIEQNRKKREEIEIKRSLEVNEINQLKSEVDLKKRDLEKIKCSLRINNISEISYKLNELKSATSILSEMNQFQEKKNNDLEIELEHLREKCENVLFTLDSSRGVAQQKGEEMLESEQMGVYDMMERERKMLANELFHNNLTYERNEGLFLNCALVLSRIYYQLNDNSKEKLEINEENMVDYLTRIGLRFERAVSSLEGIMLQDDLKDNRLGLDIKSDLELGEAKRPPTWLHLKKNEPTLNEVQFND